MLAAEIAQATAAANRCSDRYFPTANAAVAAKLRFLFWNYHNRRRNDHRQVLHTANHNERFALQDHACCSVIGTAYIFHKLLSSLWLLLLHCLIRASVVCMSAASQVFLNSRGACSAMNARLPMSFFVRSLVLFCWCCCSRFSLKTLKPSTPKKRRYDSSAKASCCAGVPAANAAVACSFCVVDILLLLPFYSTLII
jgi:hypothetical protein